MTRFAGILALAVLAVSACASPIYVVEANEPVSVTRVSDFRMDDEDPIVPVRIAHNSEQIWNGETLEQNYNYLIYEFETERHFYRARSYLDDIHTVAIFGPFDKGNETPMPLEGVEIDERVISYLRRRYAEVRRFGPNGYEVIEPISRSE